ncbi:hypothetical protein ACRHK7_00255 [Weissella tructae]|uniref:hypothetical protein n=1 Tax=Weissella tructae TaxID=887702 RepID=UPI003D8DEA9B
MNLFTDIIKGMPNGAETLQENFELLDNGIKGIKGDGTIQFGKVATDELNIGGTIFMTEPKSLDSYLTKPFVANDAKLQYLIMGKMVVISGTVYPKEVIDGTKLSQGGTFPVYERLPFKLATDQSKIRQGSSWNTFMLLAEGDKLSIQKHQRAGQWAPLSKGGYLNVSGTFMIE